MRYCPTCGARFSNEAAFCPHDGIPTEELPQGAEGPAEDPLVAQTLDGRYRIDEPLGEGGMGVVYTATHAVLGKRIAVKVLRREMARDEDVVQRFMQEAQAASSIGHPNIVDINDFGHLEDGSVYFVMEHLEGQPLTDLIAQAGSLPLGEVIDLVRQIASAVGAAHDRGIVHRDLKPDNIFLTERDGRDRFVKVLDFGVAKVGGAANKLTKTGVVFGTPHYMSPEQAAGQGVDHRTDVYALGVIMYEMMAGKVPFDAETFMGILSKHMFEEPPRPTTLKATGELGVLENVVLKALAKKSDARYQSMDDLIDDLERVRRGETVTLDVDTSAAPPRETRAAEPAATPKPDTGGSPALPERRTPLVVGVLAAALGLVGGGIALAASMLGADGEEVSAQAAASGAGEPEPGGEPGGAEGAAEPGTDGDGGADARATGEGTQVATVALDSEPSGAQVMVEGAVIANTPTELPRPEGEQTRALRIRLPGYEEQRVVLSAASPESMSVTLEKTREPRKGGRPTSGGRVPGPKVASDDGEDRPEQTSGSSDSSGEREGEYGQPGLGSEVVDPWAD